MYGLTWAHGREVPAQTRIVAASLALLRRLVVETRHEISKIISFYDRLALLGGVGGAFDINRAQGATTVQIMPSMSICMNGLEL
jgi:hypothetical protein